MSHLKTTVPFAAAAALAAVFVMAGPASAQFGVPSIDPRVVECLLKNFGNYAACNGVMHEEYRKRLERILKIERPEYGIMGRKGCVIPSSPRMDINTGQIDWVLRKFIR